MPQVRCTGAWWYNKTYYRAGSLVTVPEGTAVPVGFFVDGVEIPRPNKKAIKEATAIQKLQAELDAKNAELDLLKSAFQQKPAKPGYSGRKEH